MKRSITFAVAAAAVLALSGCGTGLYSQTADQVAPVPGVNATAQGPGGVGSVDVRNATVPYPGVEGYKAGSEATLQLHLFNQTPDPVRVVVTSSDGTITMDDLTIEPQSYAKPDVKIKLNKDVNTVGEVQITVEFVGVVKMPLELPVAPPDQPVPAHTIEFEDSTDH